MVGRLLGVNSFSARAPITVGDHRYEIFRLAALDDTFGIHRLPYSLKILLENLLRFEDGVTVTAADIEGLAAGDHGGVGDCRAHGLRRRAVHAGDTELESRRAQPGRFLRVVHP